MPTIKHVGDRVGPYQLTGVLGEGGAGQVFRARWEPDDTERASAADGHPNEVAVKLLRSAHAGSESVFFRFVREIGLAQRLHHPHIVRHWDSGLAEDYLYYAMELVPYGSLRDTINRRRVLSWRDAAEAAEHIADALACLHDAGVVHRDLKPDNVFLADDGRLKLGDFGLAKTEGGQQLTLAGQTVGSVRYMAPEQVKGQRDLDGRCDLYALGCVLFEMVMGRPPFTSTDPMVVFYKHVEEEPPRLGKLVPDTPNALDELVDRLLEKHKANRPPSAHGVRDALAAIRQSEDGNVPNLDDLLIGDVAPIEAVPQEDDERENEESLAGLTSRPIAGGLSVGESLPSESTPNESVPKKSNSYTPPANSISDQAASLADGGRSNLAKRLAEGGGRDTATASINLKGLLAAILLLAVGMTLAAIALNHTDDGTPALPLVEDAPP